MMRNLFHWGPRSLSARVFWLTVAIILLVDLFVMMPGMAREWQICLKGKVSQAELAVSLATGASGQNANVLANPQTRNVLSALSGTVAITLIGNGVQIALLPDNEKLQEDPTVDLDHAGLWNSAWQADRDVLGLCAPYVPVTASFPLKSYTRIDVVLKQAPMAARIRGYAIEMIAFSVGLALITGSLVYVALDRLLVKPMRIMTASIVAFGRDPEYARLSGLKWLSSKGDDEVSRAARELVIMQDELRTALWRNAQLAALGTAVAKISHDLRNILGSTLLVAERIQKADSPMIRQAADTLAASMARAVELVSRMADAGASPPAITRSPVLLRELVDEVSEFVRQGRSGVTIENMVPGSLVLPLDRNQIYRVLVNLLRNAAEAGATRVTLAIEEQDKVTQLVVSDDGPGLPRKALAGLFRPFEGSGRNGGTGLGLAIARDLVRAHGGDLLLRQTGAGGTEFVMSLPVAEAVHA
jgi:signal transduction histidine kinase